MEALKSYPDAYAGVQATLKGEQPANTQQQFRQDGYEDDGDEILTKKQLLAALEERDRIREQNALSRQVAAEKHQVGRTIDAAAREYGLNQQQYEAAWSEVLTDLPQAEALMSQPGGATAVGRLLAKAMRSQATQSQMQAHVAKTAGKEAEKIRKAQLTAQPEQVAPAADAKKSKRMKFVQQLNESKPQSARDLIGT